MQSDKYVNGKAIIFRYLNTYFYNETKSYKSSED